MTQPFTAQGLRKARQMVNALPEAHQDLLLQLPRATNSTPRQPVLPVSERNQEVNPTVTYDAKVTLPCGQWQKEYEFTGEVRVPLVGEPFYLGGVPLPANEKTVADCLPYPILRHKTPPWRIYGPLRHSRFWLTHDDTNGWVLSVSPPFYEENLRVWYGGEGAVDVIPSNPIWRNLGLGSAALPSIHQVGTCNRKWQL